MLKLSNKLIIDDITIEVIQKNIRTLRLTVRPPQGEVRISTPQRIGLETVRLFALSKLDWIRKHQTKLRSQPWKSPFKYESGEEHFFLGNPYHLEVLEHRGKVKLSLVDKNNSDPSSSYDGRRKTGTSDLKLLMLVPSKTSRKRRQKILDEWYRQRLKEIVPNFIQQYETKMKVHVEEWGIKKMKTKWGTCNITKKRIWVSLELAKKPVESIEHVVVHEMVHLLERKHNARFKQLMDLYLPKWREIKGQLKIDHG